MAPTVVKSTLIDGYGTTLTVPVTSTAGNTLVIAVSVGNTNKPTDTAGNTWVLALDTSTIGASSQRLGQIWYCINAQPVTSVTITHAAAQNYCGVIVELAGVQTLAVSAMNTGTSTVPAANANPDDLVLNSCFYFQTTGTSPVAAPAGFTAITTAVRGNNFNAIAQRTATTAGTAGASWGLGSNGAQLVTVWRGAVVPPFYRKVGTEWKPADLIRL